MNDKVLRLLMQSKKVNSEVITQTRLMILALLMHFIDGVQYRELKSALDVSDGKLISNLRKLEKFRYIKKEEIVVGKKKLDVYSITDDGISELKRVVKWLRYLIDLVSENG
ncbi:MAG: transcriptional regulator [Candidatus Asgardarchaeia archaeon]